MIPYSNRHICQTSVGTNSAFLRRTAEIQLYEVRKTSCPIHLRLIPGNDFAR